MRCFSEFLDFLRNNSFENLMTSEGDSNNSNDNHIEDQSLKQQNILKSLSFSGKIRHNWRFFFDYNFCRNCNPKTKSNHFQPRDPHDQGHNQKYFAIETKVVLHAKLWTVVRFIAPTCISEHVFIRQNFLKIRSIYPLAFVLVALTARQYAFVLVICH